MNKQHFVLIRHAQSAINLSQPARLWPLTPSGQQQAAELGQQLGSLGLTRLVTSEETKAQQTGEAIAQVLGVPCQTAVNLHEHDRSNVTHMPTAQFKANVAQLLTEPHTHVFGNETGEAARLRFETAVVKTLKAYPQGRVGIVAHGTVITLLLAAHQPIEPVAFWQALPMPAALVLESETLKWTGKLITLSSSI